jgi:Leucine-rich repeat (LRR) protein
MLNKKIINNMKTKKLLLAVLLMSFAANFPVGASVVLDSAHFPDAIFRAFVSTWTGVAENSTIGNNVISSKTALNCYNKGITNLQGIEYFTALTDLDCSYNQLAALDVSHNTKLTILNCCYNQLAALDVTHNTKLKTLLCDDNQLAALNVTHNTLLTDLRCHSNQITALDVSQNTKLLKLRCFSNKISALNVSHNTKLTLLNCDANQLTSINVNANTALIDFECSNNQITALNVIHNTALLVLDCSNNKIPSIDVTHNIKLIMLQCHKNPFTSALNVTMDTALTYLSCYKNQLSALDVTHNTKLTNLLCNNNNLTALDATHNTLLEILWCDNNQIPTLDVTHCGNLKVLACNNNQLTTLDVSQNTLLKELYFETNHLAAIDLSSNNNLYRFNGTNNGRKIKVYSYTRSAANGGGIGYYVPLTEQTTGTHPTKALATLIDDAGQSGDPAFDISKVVTGSWANGATLGTLNGTQVLLLDTATHKFTYNCNTAYTGSANWWSTDNGATPPNNNFYLTWDQDQVVTGVDCVESNDVSVYATAGTINIGGNVEGKVNVYNMRGQQVYCGNDSEIAVPAGMYVVKVGGKAHKVVVR